MTWPFFFDGADAEVAERTRTALNVLKAAGTEIVELPLPAGFDAVHAMHRRIMVSEAADYHRASSAPQKPATARTWRSFSSKAHAVPLAEYQAALRHQSQFANATARLSGRRQRPCHPCHTHRRPRQSRIHRRSPLQLPLESRRRTHRLLPLRHHHRRSAHRTAIRRPAVERSELVGRCRLVRTQPAVQRPAASIGTFLIVARECREIV